MTIVFPGRIIGRNKVTAAKTLQQMRRNIRADRTSPDVWELARSIIVQTDDRDQAAQARRIRRWAKMRFRYVADPTSTELLSRPLYLLHKIKAQGFVQGDCDDAATLTAALLGGIGIAATLEAVAFDRPDAPFSHVFTIASPRNGPPLEMDVSHPDDSPPRVFSRRITQRI